MHRASRARCREATRECDLGRGFSREPLVVMDTCRTAARAQAVRASQPHRTATLDLGPSARCDRVRDALDVRHGALQLRDAARRHIASRAAAVAVARGDDGAGRWHHSAAPVSETDESRAALHGVVASERT